MENSFSCDGRMERDKCLGCEFICPCIGDNPTLSELTFQEKVELSHICHQLENSRNISACHNLH